jgi:hypothetical protein
MLRDLQTYHRQIVHLAAFAEHDRCVLAQPCLASGADGRTMLDHLVGRGHQMQRLPLMPQLPTRLLAAPPALAAGTLAPQRIAGGRLVAGVAILPGVGQARFQLLHTHTQRGDLLPLALILGFQFGDTVLWRSSREEASLPLPPLRTVQATCTAHGSISLSTHRGLWWFGPFPARQRSVDEPTTRTYLFPCCTIITL